MGGQHGVVELRLQEFDQLRSRFAGDLPGAVSRGEFHNDHQPIDGRIVGAEALVRWDHRTRGLIEPALTVPLADVSRMIIEIGDGRLSALAATANAGATARQALSSRLLSTFSPQQLMAPIFVATVATVLNETGAPPGSLSLEVTEVFSYATASTCSPCCATLIKQMGTKIVLDDLGTGYSSLTHTLPLGSRNA